MMRSPWPIPASRRARAAEATRAAAPAKVAAPSSLRTQMPSGFRSAAAASSSGMVWDGGRSRGTPESYEPAPPALGTGPRPEPGQPIRQRHRCFIHAALALLNQIDDTFVLGRKWAARTGAATGQGSKAFGADWYVVSASGNKIDTS